MTREQMLDQVITHYGFENKWVIWFAGLYEDPEITDEALASALACVECGIATEIVMAEEED